MANGRPSVSPLSFALCHCPDSQGFWKSIQERVSPCRRAVGAVSQPRRGVVNVEIVKPRDDEI